MMHATVMHTSPTKRGTPAAHRHCAGRQAKAMQIATTMMFDWIVK